MLHVCMYISVLVLCMSLVQRRRWLSLAIWLLFVYVFWKLGDPFPILSPRHGELMNGVHAYTASH